MRQKLFFLFLIACFIGNLSGRLTIQAQSPDAWSLVVPVGSFGYGHTTSLYWSPRTAQLAVASASGLQFYDENLNLQGERQLSQTPTGAVFFSPDMRYIAIEEFGGLVVRQTDSWEAVLALGNYRSPSWSPDSRYLAVWVGNNLRIWDIETSQISLEASEIISEGTAIQWSPDSQVMAVAGPGAIVMFRADTGDIVRIHPFYGVENFDWSDDGQWFAVIGIKDAPPLDHDPNIPLTYELMRVNAITGEIVMRYDVKTSEDPASVNSAGGYVQISPNGQLIAAGLKHWLPNLKEPPQGYQAGWHNLGLGVWQLESGERSHDVTNNLRPMAKINAGVWSPDGNYFGSMIDSTLTIFDAKQGIVSQILQAYISSTNNTYWLDNGTRLVVEGGKWDVTRDLPTFDGPAPSVPPSPRLDLSFLEPNPYVFDYNKPPYRWHIVQVYEDRGLIITYEQDIEYPGTPEYEDEEPPAERYVIWNIATQERWEERLNIGEQTAWLYDLENADERAEGNTYFNVLRTTRFVSIGDDEIVDLRTGEKTMLEVNRWEWREVWFGAHGKQIYAYDTDQRFKAYDPISGQLLYETVPAERNSFKYSDDLSLFIVRDAQNILYVYDSETGEQLLDTYTGNQSMLLLWSSDMRRLAIGGDNNAIIVYDIPTKTRLAVLRGHKTAIRTMSWYPNCDFSDVSACDYVMASTDTSGRVILWGVPGEENALASVPQEPAPPSIDLPVAAIDYGSLEPLWTYVAEEEKFGRAQAYDVNFGDNGIVVNGRWFYDLNLNPLDEHPGGAGWTQPIDETFNGLQLFANGRVWGADNKDYGQAGRNTVYDATFNDTGSRIFTAESTGGRNSLTGWVREWSLDVNSELPVRPVTYFGGGSPAYNQIELSPDGQWLATTTVDFYGSGGRGQIWSNNGERHQLYHSLIGHTDTITTLYWHSISDHLLTASRDGSVRMWDIEGNELARWTHPQHAPIVEMNWGPTLASLLISVGDDLCELNAYTLEEMRCLPGLGGRDFDWSPDKTQVVAIASDSVVRVIDYASGDVQAEERRHMPGIAHLEYNPDGESLAVARNDGSVILLDSANGQLLKILRPYGPSINEMKWNAAGNRLLLDLDNTQVDIIDSQTGDVVTQINNPWRRHGVWWSPDGSKIAFGTFPDPNMGVYTATSLVWVYDARTGEPLNELSLDWDDYSWYWDVKPFALTWSTDSDTLAAFYGKDRLRVWDLRTSNIISTQFGVGRTFSLAIWQEDALYFWMVEGNGHINLATGALDYIARDGLPYGTSLRPDGKVLLADSRILDFQTFYPLQALPGGFSDATWHPTCYTSDCPEILAVAYDSNVVMFGYPQEEK